MTDVDDRHHPPHSQSSTLSLDDLLSPTSDHTHKIVELPSTRTSVAESELSEVAIDDDGEDGDLASGFSSVPLSAAGRASFGGTVKEKMDGVSLSLGPRPQDQNQEEEDITIGGAGNENDLGNGVQRYQRPRNASVDSISSTKALHRKSAASVSTTRHSATVPFFHLQQSTTGQTPLSQHDELESEAESESQPQESANSHVDWDFWGLVISDYQQYASENPQTLANAIQGGIPDTLRGMMWQLMSASKDTELEARYLHLLRESSTHEKAILRDLGRTFPHHDFFTDGQGIGQENLFNVLKAYSIHDTQVGYCQGLPFVVAVLLLNMPDELAFCLLIRLMHSYGLRQNFLPEMPGLQLRLYQFDRLVEELLPVLHVHFLRQGVKSSMYCSQWFLTLFSYRFPLEVVYRIYDNVLASGIEAIFGFGLALLHKNEDALLALKFDDILAYLKNHLLDVYIIKTKPGEELGDEKEKEKQQTQSPGGDGRTSGSHKGKESYNVDEFVHDAVSVKITPFMLDAYTHEYDDMVRVRDARAIEMDELRNTNRQLSAQIRTMEASLSQLNEEHCELVKELVMVRLKNEEMEGELVRYKLLYADAMHENGSIQSSHRMSMMTLR